MMKIKPKMLSKTGLTGIVNAAMDAGIIKEELLLECFKVDLHNQIVGIGEKLKPLDKQLENKKLTRAAHQKLVEKQNKLAILGNKKIQQLKELSDDK